MYAIVAAGTFLHIQRRRLAMGTPGLNNLIIIFSFFTCQVYKRKTEMAKKEYLHAMAAYRANQMSLVTTHSFS